MTRAPSGPALASRAWSRIPKALPEAAFVAALVVLCVLTWLPRLGGPIDLRWDAAVYYVLGTSLAEGRGYRLLSEPGEISATQYPPGLPLLVAAHERLVGSIDPYVAGHALRLSAFLLFTLFILSAYALLRLHVPVPVAFLGALLCLVSFWLQFMSDLLSPEIPFALVTTCFFLCQAGGPSARREPLAGLLAVAGYALRSVGVTLFAAWIGEALLEGRFRRALVRAGVALVPMLAWTAYVHGVESDPRYDAWAYAYQREPYMFYNVSYAQNMTLLDPLRPELGRATLADGLRRSLARAQTLPFQLGEAVTGTWHWGVWRRYMGIAKRHLPFPVPDWAARALLSALGCVVLAGIVVLLWKREWLLALYVLASLAVISLWPRGEPLRFLAPLLPFLLVCLFVLLLGTASRRRGPTPARLILTIVVGLALLANAALTSYEAFSSHRAIVEVDREGRARVVQLFDADGHQQALEGAVQWLRAHARPDDIVATVMPHWIYLRTGLGTVLPPLVSDPVTSRELLDSVPAAYLLVHPIVARYARPVLRGPGSGWERVYPSARPPGSPEAEVEIYRRDTATTTRRGAPERPRGS